MRILKKTVGVDNHAITLIALVITIIVLLILAGISINLVAGSNGLIERTERAVTEHRKAEDKEIIIITYDELYIDNKVNKKEISSETLKEALEEKGKDVSVEDKQGNEEKIIIIFKDTGNAYEVDKNTGEIEYIGSYTGKYEDIEFKQADIIFNASSTEEWSNEDVTVEINVNEAIDMTNFELQVSKDGQNWETYTKEITLTETGNIYAKIVDKVTGQIKTTGSITIKIDKEKPIVTSATTTTNKITFDATDEISGIVGYAVTESTTEPTDFTPCENTKTFNITVTNKEQGKDYYVWVIDDAGNVSKYKLAKTGSVVVSKGNIESEVTGWDETTATVSFTTTTEYYIQTKVGDGDWSENSPTTGSATSTATTGTTVYARLTDSSGQYNAGDVASITPILTYTVAYNANGGTGNTASSSHDYGTAKALTANGFSYSGKHFTGWATSSGGSVAYSNGQSVSNLTKTNGATVTLYAVWANHSYTSTVTTAATCTTTGVRTYTCGCGASYTETIAATGHNWVQSTQHITGYGECGGSCGYYDYYCANNNSHTTTGGNWDNRYGHNYGSQQVITGYGTISGSCGYYLHVCANNSAHQYTDGAWDNRVNEIALSATGIAQGDYIDLGNDPLGTGNTATNWRVLKVESSYVYAILADYLPNGEMPSGTFITKTGYRLYSYGNRDYLINYLTNRSIWSKFTNGISGASCVGAVTKDFMSGCGFTKNSLFVPHTYQWNDTMGYLMASPFEGTADRLWNVECSIGFYYDYYNSTYYGVRPVVSLPSTTLVNKVNGVWKVK